MSTATALKNTTWCPGGLGTFRTDFANPAGSAAHIAGWALSHVYPLNDWLGDLIGNESELAGFSADWNLASTELSAMTHAADDALRVVADMEGKSIRSLRRALEDVRDISTDTCEWTEATAAALSLASKIVTMLHDSVAGALSELAGLIASLFDFSFSLASLDPLDKWRKLRKLADHVDKFVRAIERLLDDMFSAFDELVRLIHALGPVIDEAMDRLRRLLSHLADVMGFPVGSASGGVLGIFLGTLIAGPFGGLIAGAGGFVIGGVIGDTTGGIISDRLADDPKVAEIDVTDLEGDPTGDQAKAFNKAMECDKLTSLTDFVTQNGYTDAMGKHDRTVIDVKRMLGEDGTEHWVVSLPSTQDWNILKSTMGEDAWADILKDYPSANDLDTNVALMLADHPTLATQYERATYEAMRQAGIPAGADVVYTGFSQGGIMSAALATDSNSPYNPIGIVTTGAPIDRFAIPDDVKVVSFAHESEIVANFDNGMKTAATVASIVTGSPLPLLLYGGNNEDTTILLQDPTVAPNGKVPSVHSVDGYTQSVSEWEVAHSQEAAELSLLFGGTVIDHQTYAFTE